ncbi:MAG TPA: non-heme iron oxygenase ferredoxin subunit [Actinomycetota bacterium]|nr:non-heme iron oxygenase ferredoxin subunit [Actinomycetota bacterium]
MTVGKVDDVPEGEVRRFDVNGRQIAVINLGDSDFRAIGNVCSHAEAFLHEGDVDVEERTIECPRHGSVFHVDTGEPESLPATVPVPSYTVKIEDDEIKVEL